MSRPVDTFYEAAKEFCSWAQSPAPSQIGDAAVAFALVSRLLAAASTLGWSDGDSADINLPVEGEELVRRNASALPFQYYSEIFSSLVVPPEDPVTGDITEDLSDIYSDIVPGIHLFEAGKVDEARNHWVFWFASHWGEHATSAIRALWSHLAGRESGQA